MARPFPSDFRRPIALDASVIINLNATLCAPAILGALPNHVVVVEAVQDEVSKQAHTSKKDGGLLQELIGAGLIKPVSLENRDLERFEELIAGHTADTLDDGEAATIAWAVEHNGIVAIDERKANRVAAQRFPSVPLASTVELLFHDDVVTALGLAQISEAVFLALRDARMRVQNEYLNRVIALLRPEQIEMCLSLPRWRREEACAAFKSSGA
jgi:predicted nucleic acid-binding protein